MRRETNLYLVERYWPGVTLGQVRRAAERTLAALPAERTGGEVSYLGSALIAGEETVLSLFGAPSLSDVEDANRRGSFPFDRIISVTADCP